MRKPIESHTLPGMAEDVDRQAESAAELSGEELTAKLREPLADISKRTGKLEKDVAAILWDRREPRTLQPVTKDRHGGNAHAHTR